MRLTKKQKKIWTMLIVVSSLALIFPLLHRLLPSGGDEAKDAGLEFSGNRASVCQKIKKIRNRDRG